MCWLLKTPPPAPPCSVVPKRTSKFLLHPNRTPYSFTPPSNYPYTAMASSSSAVTAEYKSPTNEDFTSNKTIPALASDSLAEKTKNLEALRTAVTETQQFVNEQLTARMAEDNKARDDAAAAEEEKEEENYGEEVQEEED